MKLYFSQILKNFIKFFIKILQMDAKDTNSNPTSWSNAKPSSGADECLKNI